MSRYPRRRQDVRKRVLLGVRSEDRGFDTPCWLWQGETDRNGYGRIKRDGRRIPVHWVLIGDPAEGLEVDHLCRQRACVRPEHLEYVTHAENNRRKNDSNQA
jgi:hypothetical protein